MNLTREQIEQMPAGRELDGLIAVQLFGFVPTNYRAATVYEHPDYQKLTVHEAMSSRARELLYSLSGELFGVPSRSIPFYSTDIAAAWQVVEALKGREHFVQLQSAWAAGWVAVVVGPDPDPEEKLPLLERPWPKRSQAGAPTAPLAICRAALLAHTQE